ncbi:MAG TPA: helix-turn-helix domain-containing protein [Ktedonobacteraceae bacterium]|nr:helix-turn-helix domain-containing protein [Ktedonobacteraceae bacterium]HVB75899.1 helix-turn-helix domain-containing protein [Ktedonobacteraceae bacterium]
MPYDPPHQQMGRSVGAKLKEARLAKKYTQSQLAGDDFSVSYISAIERGQIHPSLRALEIFAMRLGLSSKDLLVPQTSAGGAVTPTRKGSSNAEEVDWQLLAARVAIEQDKYQQAIRQLQELASHKLTNAQEIIVHYLLALAFSKSNQWHESENALLEAFRLAKDEQSYLYAQLLYLQGITQSALQDHSQGLVLHERSLELLEAHKNQDAFFKGDIYSQLGLHNLRLNRPKEAQAMFLEALKLTDGLTSTQHIAVYWQSCQQLVESGDYLQSTLDAYKCLHLLTVAEEQTSKSEIFHALGRAMLAMHDPETRAYLENALEQPEVLRDRQMQASAHLHLAAWFLEHEEVAEAKKQAQKALALLSSEDHSMIAADARIILGKIEYAQKRYKAGDSHFDAGLDILEKLNRLEDLADYAAEYAQLLENHGNVNRAVLYWKKAYDSRQRMFRPGGE